MKRLLTIAAAVLALCLSVSAQAQDKSAKAAADLQKMVGAWNFEMDNPMGGEPLTGIINFVKDAKGVHFEMGSDELGKMVSDPFKPEASGKSSTVFTVKEYDVDVLCYLELKDDGSVKMTMESSGLVMEPKLTPVKK